MTKGMCTVCGKANEYYTMTDCSRCVNKRSGSNVYKYDKSGKMIETFAHNNTDTHGVKHKLYKDKNGRNGWIVV